MTHDILAGEASMRRTLTRVMIGRVLACLRYVIVSSRADEHGLGPVILRIGVLVSFR